MTFRHLHDTIVKLKCKFDLCHTVCGNDNGFPMLIYLVLSDNCLEYNHFIQLNKGVMKMPKCCCLSFISACTVLHYTGNLHVVLFYFCSVLDPSCSLTREMILNLVGVYCIYRFQVQHFTCIIIHTIPL